MMSFSSSSYFGSYLTRTFSDIFEGKVENFMNEYKKSPFYTENEKLDDAHIELTFYLLYSRYGNSHTAGTDVNQFKFKLFSLMFMHGPAWVKKLEVQSILRNLTEEQLEAGSIQLYNHSMNPSTEVIDPKEPLKTINAQNTAIHTRGKLEAYSNLLDLLKNDVSKQYIDKFSGLFLKIVEPQEPLWYITDKEGE